MAQELRPRQSELPSAVHPLPGNGCLALFPGTHEHRASIQYSVGFSLWYHAHAPIVKAILKKSGDAPVFYSGNMKNVYVPVATTAPLSLVMTNWMTDRLRPIFLGVASQ